MAILAECSLKILAKLFLLVALTGCVWVSPIQAEIWEDKLYEIEAKQSEMQTEQENIKGRLSDLERKQEERENQHLPYMPKPYSQPRPQANPEGQQQKRTLP